MSELQEQALGQGEIDLTTLPSLPLHERRRLPNCSAVYFVTDIKGVVVYVGSSKSLTLRWLQHDKYIAFTRFDSPVISWLELPEDELLTREGYYIKALKPVLNTKIPTPTNTVKARKVGGCLMLTIPQQITRELRLNAGDDVRISLNGESVIIEPVRPGPKGKGRR